tara:strand:+ start:85 stop:768 length:684 start_codon:yes stop_codon:yes gene_type:complete
MKIVLENFKFDFDRGCKLLKLKHKECPFPNTYIAEIWNDIIPATFSEIAKYENVEERRVGILCLGLERLVSEVKPKLVDKQTLKKTTSWINSKGELETISFTDTYKLFKVEGKYFNEGIKNDWNKVSDCYYVQFKDTSTDREYMLWVDVNSVYRANNENRWDFSIDKINAIDCIAWTIQTDIAEGNIEKIVRQGDCIMIKPLKPKKDKTSVRHLTSEEYKTLLVAES